MGGKKGILSRQTRSNFNAVVVELLISLFSYEMSIELLFHIKRWKSAIQSTSNLYEVARWSYLG